jgi:hypothetical protein
MQAYISLPVALWLVTSAPSAQAGDGAGETARELASAAAKTARAKSYTFRIEERGGRGPAAVVTGAYQQGQPVSLKADGIHFFRKGEVLVYEQGGKWQRSKTGRESDPLRILGGAAKVRRARLPSEALPDLAGAFKTVTRSREKGVSIYSGPLTEQAVKKLAPTEFRSVARSGRAKAWVDGGGLLTKYEIEIRVQGRLGNAEVDTTVLRTTTLDEVGSVRLTVPAAVRKALE